MDRATYGRMAEIQDRHWWYEGRRRILRSLIARLGFKEGARILEVGCGPGANLKMLTEFGTVTGVEPDDFSVGHARVVSGCRVEKGTLPDSLGVSGPFDLVCAFDVIEHVEEDLQSLQALRRVMEEDGYALFTVPAYRFLWSHHDVVNHHKRRYTKGRFARLLRQAGYEIGYISYYNTALLPAVIATRFLKKLLRIKDKPDEVLPGQSFLNTALCRIFSSERFLLGHVALPAGISIVAVCRNRKVNL
jgi:SAM-dependent methyltransferase